MRSIDKVEVKVIEGRCNSRPFTHEQPHRIQTSKVSLQRKGKEELSVKSRYGSPATLFSICHHAPPPIPTLPPFKPTDATRQHGQTRSPYPPPQLLHQTPAESRSPDGNSVARPMLVESSLSSANACFSKHYWLQLLPCPPVASEL